MCTKAEVREVIEDVMAPIVVSQQHLSAALIEMKGALAALPCNQATKDIMELTFQQKEDNKSITDLQKTKEDLYKKYREIEKPVDELVRWQCEVKEGKKDWSAKTWAMLMIGFNVLLSAILMLFI